MQYVVHKGGTDFDVPLMPKKAAQLLRENFVLTTSEVVEEQKSSKGCKLVIKLQDGLMVETVVIEHGDAKRHDQVESRGKKSGHITVCVSSQVS